MTLVQFRHGDMFDGPSDLIVLPCSTAGTITPYVRQRLVHHNIPFPAPGMQLGDVVVMPFEGGESIAQWVAFAASVAGRRSNLEAITRIGEQLGDATVENPGMRLVVAPLLGAGAGGLPGDAVATALTLGFKRRAHEDARLVIHVLDNVEYERLAGILSPGPGDQVPPTVSQPIRVFVSYAHTSVAHQQWVEGLASFLRANGIDAHLDAWHLRRGMDLPQFMTNELTLADRVVIVSDERYAEKADGRVGGVGWETMIVQGDIAKQPPDSTKYLIVVRSDPVDAGLPPFLMTKFVIHWPDATYDDDNRRVLLQELYNVIEAPPLGPRPLFI